ncbi:MAG: transglutaminase-like domain-containing protein [Gemmataceae bacterium]
MRPARAARLASIFVACLPVVAAAQVAAVPATTQPTSKIVKDNWDAAYLDGHRAGYVRLKVEEFTLAGGAKVIRASQEMNLNVRRGNDVNSIMVVTGTDELPDGKLIGVFMQQTLGKGVQQVVHGKVQGNQLQLTAQGPQGNFNKLIPWDPRVVSAAGEAELLSKRDPKPKPGDKFDYYTFNPVVNTIVPIHVTVESFEEVPIRTANGVERPRLLRVSAVPDEIFQVQLPSQLLWFDANYELRRSMANLPGIGYLVLEKSTETAVKQPIARELLVDIMERQSIKLNRRITTPHALSEIVYRITLDDKDPAKTFAQDDRQSVTNIQGKTFDLTVRAVRTPPAQEPPGTVPPGPEFTTSNYFLTSDDTLVKQRAQAAIGGETDPWRKALLIERWVHTNMKVLNFSEAMVPAFKVAQTLEGDCTEYSMLTAAMCRAVGVPSRTVIGLVYVDVPAPRQPLFGFHMWTEVWVRGAWVSIDSTLGQGNIGPAHLKIADASWHDQRAMTPLLPLMRVIVAKPMIEPVSVK